MEKCKYEGTGIWDGRCIGTKEVDPCPGYDKCKKYKPNYTTNADHIRSMSDEELANVVANGVGCVLKAPHCMDVDCTPCILKWLKQPFNGIPVYWYRTFCINDLSF